MGQLEEERPAAEPLRTSQDSAGIIQRLDLIWIPASPGYKLGISNRLTQSDKRLKDSTAEILNIVDCGLSRL